MDDAKKAVAMWSMGFGDRNEALSGDSVKPARPRQRALRSDWKTRRMPRAHAKIDLDIPLTTEEFELLALGHIPQTMEDHWFSYFDGESLNLHRSWTGVCVYRVHVARRAEGYVLTGVTVNRDASQYSQTSDERDLIMVSILIGEALGRDVSGLWEEYFSVGPDEGASRPAASSEDGPTLIGFWREKDALGFCSNWHPSGLVFCGREFCTAEHWMMWQKARVMGDTGSADAILETPTPRRAKELGARVKPYDDALWRDVREQLVYVGVREKFMQNPKLAERLLATGVAVLAEASPYDRSWGIGLAEHDKRFRDISLWRGSNLLGRVCMRVRSDLGLAAHAGVDVEKLSGCGNDMVFSLCDGRVGSMSLLELSRVPAARAAVLCYVRIAQHQASDTYPTLDDFLLRFGRETVAEIDERRRADRGGDVGTGGGIEVVGWCELLSQLAFMGAVGLLRDWR